MSGLVSASVARLIASLASIQASKGSDQVGFALPSVTAVARTARAKLRERVSVLDYGADKTAVADSWTAINNAIDDMAGGVGGEIYFPSGTYLVTLPIVLRNGVSLVGENVDNTTIRKTTTTAGSGTSAVPGRAIAPDSYAVDAVVSVFHDASVYAYNCGIKNLRLTRTTYAANTLGIFAPRVSHMTLENVKLENVHYGYRSFDAWMCQYTRVTAQAVRVGFQHSNDGSGAGSGTSCNFNNCWINFDNTIAQPVAGFEFFGLTYSTMAGCGSDNGKEAASGTGTVIAYDFNTCAAIAMSGCGVETHNGIAIRLQSSAVTVDSMRSIAMTGNTAAVAATVVADTGSKLTLIGCNFGGTTSPSGNFYNWVIQGGSEVVEINTGAAPAGGNAFVSYGGGSSRTIISGAALQRITAAGSKDAMMMPAGSTPVFLDVNNNLPTTGAAFTLEGTIAASAGVAATVVTMPVGVYLASASVLASGQAYIVSAMVTCDGSTALITGIKAGANLVFSLTGVDLKVTSSAAATVGWKLLRLL